MAGDLTLAVRITADAGQLKAEVVGADGAVAQLGQRAEEASRRGTAGLEGMTGAASKLGAALATTAAAGLTAMVAAGDQLTGTLGRLQTATGSLQGATRVYEELYKISLQTGISVNEGAAAFTRFAIAAREAGASQQQVLNIVRGLQQAGALAGASTQETAAATQQLAQALASGKLQGDELRSVLENMPNLAEKLAKELGVGIGQLRKMGEEGKLTADTVLPALERAAGKLNEEFEKLPPTLSRGFAQLQTAATNFLGKLDQAVGTSNALARALVAAATALDGLRQRAGLGTDQENAARAQDQAQLEVDGLRRRVAQAQAAVAAAGSSTADQFTLGPGASADRQAAAARAAALDPLASQRTAQEQRELDRLRGQLQAAERVLAEALARRGALIQQGEDEREAKERSAAVVSAQNARREAQEQLTELRDRQDKKLVIEREYQAEIERIRGFARMGLISDAEREQQLARARAMRDEALSKASGTAASAARELARGDREAAAEAKKALEEASEWSRMLQDQQARLASIGLDQSLIGTNRADASAQRARLAADQQVDRLNAQRRANGRPQVSDEARNIFTLKAEEIARASNELERQQSIFNDLNAIGTNAFDRIGSAITKAMVEGKAAMVDFKSVGKAVVSELAQEFIKLSIVNPLKNAISGNNNLATLTDLSSRLFSSNLSTSAAESTVGALIKGGIAHTGGIIGADALPSRAVPAALFATAPRFHEGGFVGPGEVPAILRRGEGVFTEQQMAALGPAGGTTINVQWQGDAGSEDDRQRLAQAIARAVARQEIARATPQITTLAKGSLADDVSRGGEAARLFGRR